MEEDIRAELAADGRYGLGLVICRRNSLAVFITLVRPASLGDDDSVGVTGGLDSLNLALDKSTGIIGNSILVEKRVAVDHDDIRCLADRRVVDSCRHSVDSSDRAVVTNTTELVTAAANGIDNLRGSHIVVVKALVLDREKLQNVPAATSVLIDSIFPGSDDRAEILAITLVAEVRAAHDGLAVLLGVLNGERYDVAAHAVDTDNF